MELKFNKFQSTLELLNIDSYPEEIKEAFFDFLNNVPYIKALVSPDRPYAKDCPRDKEEKIIVDLTNPPIIEDTDYFRPVALHYLKYGCITKLRPNPNPNSEYGKWVREEVRRCFQGYIRPSDGAWVTGDMYFFLNYCPIVKVKRLQGKQGIRIVDFPDFLEGQWLKFMYIDQARKNAKHGSELASRGKGKAHPYSERVFTPNGWKLWRDILVGDTLYSDMGLPTKVTDIPYDEESDIYRVTLADGRTVNCTSGHLFKVYNHKLKREEVKSLIDIQQDYICPRKVTAKNTKGREFNYRIPKNLALRISFKEVPVDPYTLGVLLGDGCFRSKNKNNVGFTTKFEDYLSCYRDNIPYEIHKVSNDSYSYNIKLSTNLFGDLWNKKSEDKYVPDEYKYNSDSVRLSVLLGLMDTDGTVTFGTPIFTTTSERLKEDVLFIARSLGFTCTVSSKIPKYNGKEYRKCYNIRIYATVPIFRLQRKQNLVYYKNTARVLNTSIVSIEYLGKEKAKCVTVDSPTHCYLIGDLIVTHNSYTMASVLARRFILGEYDPLTKKITKRVESFVASYLKNYLNEDGILNKFESYIDFCEQNTEFPRKRLISSINNMHWQMGYKENGSEAKKGSLNEVIGISVKDSAGKLRGKRGAFIGLEEFGSFPNLIELYGTLRPSMEDGDIVFGMIYCQGTAGDKDSDFSAALKIMYAPKAFNMQPIPNVYDKIGLGKRDFIYFYPAYVNRNGCYNKDGISDVPKAMLEVLINRYNVKYNTTDSNLITKTIAEHPIVPQEAIMRTLGNMFPVQQINERINQIDYNPNEYDDVYIGHLNLLRDGSVKFSPSLDTPIREYPIKDNKDKGAIEIYELPQKDSSGNVFPERYIIGHDPVDDDVSNTASLTSTFVLDLLTDRIVAEYTGRLEYADDNFEIVRRLCIFYNAKCMYEQNKKGIFAYFKLMNALQWLADTPIYLKDQQIIKEIGYGNKAKGVNATAAVNSFADRLTREWLIKPVVVDKMIDGESTEVTIPNLMFVRNRAFLLELVSYNPLGNFDRIRAFGMLMLYRLEKIILYQGDMNKTIDEERYKDLAENDDFFTENYDRRFED